MDGQQNEKRALERAAAERFLQRYNELVHKEFHITLLQERPDVVVEAADGTLCSYSSAQFPPFSPVRTLRESRNMWPFRPEFMMRYGCW